MVGGRGGWIINHSLVLGGGGYGVASEVDAPAGVLPLEGPLDIEVGYGGFELEYIIHPMSLVHFNIYNFIGGGATNFVAFLFCMYSCYANMQPTSFKTYLWSIIESSASLCKPCGVVIT